MKNKIISFFIAIFLLAGLALLIYPTLSDYINNVGRAKDISGYAEAVAHIEKNEYEEILRKANKYNAEKAKKPPHWLLSEKEIEEYNGLLNVSGTGVMACIEIPKIGCSLPVYHGTEASVLQIAIGHIEGSSLPIGGKSTHAVLSGHRGLPSAKLFTGLDKLEEGDTFTIRTLDEVLTYEVDKISIILPSETERLAIVPGEDLCTLMTCTPYGVNSHRLLVRGHRTTELSETEEIRITADALQIDPRIVAPIAATPILIIIFIVLVSGELKRKDKKGGR